MRSADLHDSSCFWGLTEPLLIKHALGVLLRRVAMSSRNPLRKSEKTARRCLVSLGPGPCLIMVASAMHNTLITLASSRISSIHTCALPARPETLSAQAESCARLEMAQVHPRRPLLYALPTFDPRSGLGFASIRAFCIRNLWCQGLGFWVLGFWGLGPFRVQDLRF